MRKRLIVLTGTGIILLLLGVVGCASEALQAPTPESAPNPYASLPESARTYVARVSRYDSLEAIARARDLSAQTLQQILLNVDSIVPPPGFEALHQELVDGYRFTLEGRQLLEARMGNESHAEAVFLMDWGMMHLFEHGKLLTAYLEQAVSAQSL